jgi:hypothetical protein
MGLMDFLTGKSKAATSPVSATDTAAVPAEELKSEIARHLSTRPRSMSKSTAAR